MIVIICADDNFHIIFQEKLKYLKVEYQGKRIKAKNFKYNDACTGNSLRQYPGIIG
jgi:hypothetical protein